MEESKRIFYVKIIRLVLPVVIIAIGFFAYKVLSIQKRAPESIKSETNIKTLVGEPIKLGSVSGKVKVYGTAEPAATIAVSAETSGRIIFKRKDLDNGCVVKKGEEILKIDTKDYEIALNKAIAEIEELKAKIEQQKVSIINSKPLLEAVTKKYKLEEENCGRYARLYKKGAIPKAEYESYEKQLADVKKELVNAQGEIKNVMYGLNSLNAQLKVAKTVKEQAELNIDRCTVKSPINGRLIDIQADFSEYVNVGTPLFSVIDDSYLEIPVALSADELGMILDFTPGKDIDYKHWFKHSDEENVIVQWSDSQGAFSWKAKIISVEKLDIETRTITVIVRPTTPIKQHETNFPLVAGMFCRVIFTGKEIKDAIKVPMNAIQINGCVYVVDKKTGLSKEVKVKLIRYDNYQVIISSKGLTEGDYLITQPLPHGLLNGTKVKIVKPITMQ